MQIRRRSHAAMRAVEHATAASEHYLVNFSRLNAAAGVVLGPMPVTEALGWLDQQAELLNPAPPWLDFWPSYLLPLIGRFDEARAAHSSEGERMRERGDRLGLALLDGWEIEMQSFRFAKAEEAARHSCTLLEEMQERSFWSTTACQLAQALYCLGRYEEAENSARQAADAGASEDVITQMLSRQVLAKVAARRGEFGKARTLADEALTLSRGMQAPHSQGEPCLVAAEALWLAGDYAAAIRHADRASAFFRSKGATVSLERAERLTETIAGHRGDMPACMRPVTPDSPDLSVASPCIRGHYALSHLPPTK